jgi:hypothetical protein
MDGTNVIGGGAVFTPPGGWHVAGHQFELM